MKQFLKNKIIFLIFSSLFISITIPFSVKAALSFDGMENYVGVTDNSILDLGAGDFTIEGWFYPEGQGTGGIAKYSKSLDVGFEIWTNPYSQSVDFYIAEGASKSALVEGFIPGQYDSWHHVVGVKSGQDILLYIDGDLKSQDSMPGVTNVDNDEFLFFGQKVYDVGLYQGFMGGIRVYNRALSQAEITDHFDGTYNDETGLVGLWRLEDASGNIAIDSSGNGNDGIIYGPTETVGSVTFIRPLKEFDSPPRVKINTKISGVYHKILSLDYSAVDDNPGKGMLISQPMSFYCCNEDKDECQELATEQKNEGKYDFDTTKVPDGIYTIRITAEDGYGIKGEDFSEPIVIHNTGPSFDILISPVSQIKETDKITLKITSSEELSGIPVLKITQYKADPVTINLKRIGNYFYAQTPLLRGYPGKAVISISGEDNFGNIGEVITSGASFLIEGFGPPPPVITNATNNQVFFQNNIDILGIAQPGTRIYLTLNGVDTLSATTSAAGIFEFKNITLAKNNGGYNTLSIFGVNKNGEQGGETVLKLKLNSPPKVSISTSISGEISGEKEIKWSASDSNEDKLSFSLEYSNDGGITWDILASGLNDFSYKFDTTQLADGGNYYLRVIADDGAVKTESAEKEFSIKNNLPSMSLNVPANYFTNTSNLKMEGLAESTISVIRQISYSIDGGKTWQETELSSSLFSNYQKKFKISFSEPLPDGKYIMLIRAIDNQDHAVKIARSFVIDTVSPVIEITDPGPGKSVGGYDGEQITITGKTEPKTVLNFKLGNKNYNAVSDKEGIFSIKNVVLNFHNVNEFLVSGTDQAKNTSETKIAVISDNSPEISFSNLNGGDYLGGTKEIKWSVEDKDNDKLSATIFYRNKNQENWVALPENIKLAQKDNSDIFNTTKLDNGSYEIKIVVNDGLINSEMPVNVFVDNVAPKGEFSINGSFSTNNTKPSFSGTVFDDFSGIEYIEYSLDESNWYKAAISQGYEGMKAEFEFQHAFKLPDGDYNVKVRVTDRAGNITYLEPKKLTIDTTPPKIGSNLISSGVLSLFPDESGKIKLFKDNEYKITLAVAGDAKEVILKSNDTVFNLDFNKSISLWEGSLKFNSAGDYALEVTASDAAGNSQTRKINTLEIFDKGYVYDIKNNEKIENAKIALYVLDENSNSWALWDGKAYNQENPQKTEISGEFGFLVPAGKYKLKISAGGFGSVNSKEIVAEKNNLISANIPMAEEAGIIKMLKNIF
jgi:hypothetical protein